jgi:UDP-2,3-diacylglucosamine pyrophosphatase LpxH
LGTRQFQAAALLDFLTHHEAENLFLVGDVIDGWNAGPGWYWSAAQEAVAAELRAWGRRGCRVTLIPGNHDVGEGEAERLLGLKPAAWEVIYRTGEGRRMLVTHGHQFDRTLAAGRFWQGGTAYAMAMRIHEWYGRDCGASEASRSLGAFFRYRVKRVVKYFTDFDDRAIFEAVRARHADGIICGHIHRAEQRLIGPVWYINDGDWVESRTALVEGFDGALHLVRWDQASQGEMGAESIAEGVRS